MVALEFEIFLRTLKSWEDNSPVFGYENEDRSLNLTYLLSEPGLVPPGVEAKNISSPPQPPDGPETSLENSG